MQSAFDYSDFNKIDDQWIKFEGRSFITKVILSKM